MLALSSSLLDQTLSIAQQAGAHLRHFYQSAVQIQTKSDNTPVTNADLFLSQFLTEKLRELTPHLPILSEENCNIPLSERQQWQQYWLIDPLDGTQQFIRRTDQFSILISLIQHNQTVLSVIHAPLLDTTYFAMQGDGAYKTQGKHTALLSPQPFEPTRPIKIAVGAHAAKQKVRSILNPNYQYEFLIYGSSGLKAGLVAEGCCDCYVRLGHTGEWDTAPAEILLAQMGGKIIDCQFQPLTYNQRDTFTNPDFIMLADKDFPYQDIFQFHQQSKL